MSAYEPTFIARTLFPPSSGGGGGTGSEVLTFEAGEDLVAGTPVYISANKVYAADNVTNTEVIGVVTADVLSTFLASIIAHGNITLSGLTPGEYFLGNEILQTTAPASGEVIKVGTALTSTLLVVNIQLSVLLS